MVLYCMDRFVNEISQIKITYEIVELFILNCIFCEDVKLTERLISTIPMLIILDKPPNRNFQYDALHKRKST